MICVQYDKDVGFKSWFPVHRIEPEAMRQITNVCKLPGVFKWAAIMPDVHPGFGMPIGGVVALKSKIVPNAVGVDIGCGVVLAITDLEVARVRKSIKNLLRTLMKAIPAGFRKRKRPVESTVWDQMPEDPVIQKERANASLQLGTLGGGNHFIEIQKTSEEKIALMIHSGSRHLGKAVADHYNRRAQDLLKKQRKEHPPGLAWFSLGSNEGRAYYSAMTFCQHYASDNRRIMMEELLDIMERFFDSFEVSENLETIHNYASIEEHFGEEVVVHRKGAVRASGKVIIPGSMGSASYVGQGLENSSSFKSCSHGAGRVMGRREAHDRIEYRDVIKELEQMNISIVSPDRKSVVEEARQTYKNIEEVMEMQRELVLPLERFEPIGVMKG